VLIETEINNRESTKGMITHTNKTKKEVLEVKKII
jgi:hypothetical protein